MLLLWSQINYFCCKFRRYFHSIKLYKDQLFTHSKNIVNWSCQIKTDQVQYLKIIIFIKILLIQQKGFIKYYFVVNILKQRCLAEIKFPDYIKIKCLSNKNLHRFGYWKIKFRAIILKVLVILQLWLSFILILVF